MMKCDLDARGKDIMIVVTPKDEEKKGKNPFNQYRVLSELKNEDLKMFWKIWLEVNKILQEIGGDIILTKVNSSSEEFGIYKGEYLKICQTLRSAIHAQIFGFNQKELIETNMQELTPKLQSYIKRPWQKIFNSLILEVLEEKYSEQDINKYKHSMSEAIILEFNEITENNLVLLSDLNKEIFNLFHDISLLIHQWKKKPKKFTSGEIWKSLKLDKEGRPLLINLKERKNRLKKLFSKKYSYFSSKLKQDIISEINRIEERRKSGLIFRYGPNQCLTLLMDQDTLYGTIIPTFYSGKGGDPALGILVDSEPRALEEDERNVIIRFTETIQTIFPEKFKSCNLGDWDSNAFLSSFKEV